MTTRDKSRDSSRKEQMTPKKESLAVRASRGEYELVEPLDSRLIEMLKDEGTLYAGLYPLGHTATDLAKRLSTKEAKVPASAISLRLRMLKEQGLAVQAKSITSGGGTTVWQRTKRAVELLKSRGGDGSRGQSG